MSLRKLSFDWFGGLTNISFRRSTDKSDSKSSKSKSSSGGGSEGVASAKLSPLVEATLDDMEATRPCTASYVRSSQDFTHVGTLPRMLAWKKDKSNKGASSTNKKSKDKSHISRSSTQKPAGKQSYEAPKQTTSKTAEPKTASTSELGYAPSAEPRTQAEPTGERTTTDDISAAGKHVASSGGSSEAFQSDGCEALNKTQSAHEGDDAHQDGELGTLSEPKQEAENNEPKDGVGNSDKTFQSPKAATLFDKRLMVQQMDRAVV